MIQAGEVAGLPKGAVGLIRDISRDAVTEMMKLNDMIDVLIPRGGAGLIQSVVQNATIPVIETGTGNCHIYVDKSADLAMAAKITVNAKTTRPAVCNAAESPVSYTHLDVYKRQGFHKNRQGDRGRGQAWRAGSRHEFAS